MHAPLVRGEVELERQGSLSRRSSNDPAHEHAQHQAPEQSQAVNVGTALKHPAREDRDVGDVGERPPREGHDHFTRRKRLHDRVPEADVQNRPLRQDRGASRRPARFVTLPRFDGKGTPRQLGCGLAPRYDALPHLDAFLIQPRRDLLDVCGLERDGRGSEPDPLVQVDPDL